MSPIREARVAVWGSHARSTERLPNFFHLPMRTLEVGRPNHRPEQAQGG